MSHRHFCDAAGHWWDCNGTALRRGETEPSVCICLPCGRPLEGFDHSKCPDPVELLACPEHRPEGHRTTQEATEACVPPEQGSPEVKPFVRFPLMPIEKGDPLWHCDWCCHCGCRRMPPELSGGFCFHCFHEYQRNDPEFWLGEEFPHSQAAHLKNCAAYQEHRKETEEGLAKFQAMIKGADDETFLKLLHACYSKAIDDNYDAYMSAPESSPERAAIVERIAAANREGDMASGLPDHVKQGIRSGQVVPVAPPEPDADGGH